MKFSVVCITLMAAFLPAESSKAQNRPLSESLSDPARQFYTDEISRQCIEIRLSASQGADISQEAIISRCRCFAEQMLNQFNESDFAAIVVGMTPEQKAKLNEMEQSCVAGAK